MELRSSLLAPESLLRRNGIVILLAAWLVLAAVLLRRYTIIDYDVSFLAWAAERVLGGAVYGVEVRDINPPLGMLIYMPAAVLAKAFGLEWGIRISMLVLSLLSLAALWQTAERSVRPAVATVFVLFITLAYPNHFAQREQVALLLCAPYVAGVASRRGWAITSGIMAGLAFLMKPYFLIPLALILALRRRLGTEERVMFLMGVAYALVLLIFFRPYLLVMVPTGVATYWAIAFPLQETLVQCSFILLTAAIFGFASPQASARPFLLAALGFTAGAVLQGKGFYYHFIPAFGFLAMFLAAFIVTAHSRVLRICAALFLALEAVFLWRTTLPYFARRAERAADFQAIQAEIDRSTSFISLAIEPAIAFPAAIHSPSRFLGISSCQGYMSAVEKFASGKADGDPALIYRLALDQVKAELARKPELVLVAPFGQGGTYWDLLGWYEQDEGFRELWKDYHRGRTIGPVILYHRN